MDKKCIVLDLDNTLWGGIIGEDGIENITLSIEPPGNGFLAFQQALLDHYNRGVILAINSRNNPEDAWQVIRTHPNMILKENNFAASRVNWKDKAQNLLELARELNIGLDSMVFFDDDPSNRALVRALLPEVEVPELPDDPGQYALFLNSLNLFSSKAITDEDKMRGNLYITERLRKEEEQKYPEKEDFLKELLLKLTVWEDDGTSLSRLAQLTEKTNQFNIDKQPLTEEEILKYTKSPDYSVFNARLQDKFGDYGIITFALIERRGNDWHIKSLLMSCRAFGRGAEEAFLGAILKRAREQGAKNISIAFRETEKNMPARDFILKYFKQGALDTEESFDTPSWVELEYGEV